MTVWDESVNFDAHVKLPEFINTHEYEHSVLNVILERPWHTYSGLTMLVWYTNTNSNILVILYWIYPSHKKQIRHQQLTLGRRPHNDPTSTSAHRHSRPRLSFCARLQWRRTLVNWLCTESRVKTGQVQKTCTRTHLEESMSPSVFRARKKEKYEVPMCAREGK